MRAPWSVVAAISLISCGFPQPADLHPDAARDASGDAGAPPNTVIGHSFRICEQTPASTQLNDDLSNTAIHALIPDSSAAGYQVVPGVGSSDGTFEIANVPDGATYLLEIGNEYFETAQHVVDLQQQVAQRCVPVPAVAVASTPISLDLTNMTAINPFVDQLSVNSFALAVTGEPPTQPAPFTEALTVPFDWMTDMSGDVTAGVSLVDQTLGDDLIVQHDQVSQLTSTQDGRTVVPIRLTDVFQAQGVTMTSGQTTNLHAAFTTPARAQSLSYAFDRAPYDAEFDSLSALEGASVSVIAHPVENDSGVGARLVEVDMSDWSRSAALRHQVNDLPYADPFPTSWHRFLEVTYLRGQIIKFPGAAVTQNFDQVSLNIDLPQTILTNNALQAPQNIKLAGLPLTSGGKIDFDGVAPVAISWTPVTAAKSYTVLVTHVIQSGTRTELRQVASLSTAGTSLQIPAQVFAEGPFFSLTVTAFSTPADYAGGHLIPNGVPQLIAGTASGRFRLSADCGNGVVDPGEDCDGSGETSTCNVDCTRPVCGDAVRNATAGEACDTGQDTPSCDVDCTLPVCGDGRINQAIEDCDPGSGSDPNCSASCKFKNICGNGRVEPSEACDGSGVDTATCNATCSLPVCGDGYVNMAAGEQCDDSEFNGSDGHCGSNCKLVSSARR